MSCGRVVSMGKGEENLLVTTCVVVVAVFCSGGCVGFVRLKLSSSGLVVSK